MGTPKTLLEAVRNGLEDFERRERGRTLTECIESHIADFINQKLCVLTISSNREEVRAAIKLQALIFEEDYERKEVS